MSTREPKAPSELMRQYWDACRARGEKPRRVFGLVACGPKAEQPKGYCIAWGVLRAYVETQQEKRSDADHWEILEFEPDEI